MPPRSAPGRGTGPRGGPRGRGRGGGAARESTRVDSPSIAASVSTVGVKRSGTGTAGRKIAVRVNAFETTVQEGFIYHYDVDIIPSTLPVRMNMLLIKQLQAEVARNVFTPPVPYDGRKNMYASRELPLGPNGSSQFDVSVFASASAGGRPPKVYQIKVTKVAVINPEILQRFIQGEQSQDNNVSTALMALNVAIRMAPNQKYPFNTRSFFTEDGKRPLRGGIELWRGYFQSIRPSMGKMIINLDISTGLMYKPGPLIGLCLDFFGKNDPNILSPKRGLPDRERLRLQRFISNIRITTSHGPSGRAQTRVVRKLSSAGASGQKFTMRESGEISVADYFRVHARKTLKFPDLLCVEVGSGALLPLELCDVPPGQIMRKQVPPHLTKDVVEFSTMKPIDRFESIKKGLQVLSYGQSEYVRQFGMNVNDKMIELTARVLDPPTLKYGQGSKRATVRPANGSWNMADKKFFRPSVIKKWVIVVYEGQRRFTQDVAQQMATSFVAGARAVGMTVQDDQPVITWENGQGRIGDQLKKAGQTCVQQKGEGPNLIVVILPDGGDDIYTAVKHFGDVTMGVATQCLLAKKCYRANAQYWANVMLKVNVKLDGINSVPDLPSLTDPAHPTIIMGADVIHPAPGTEGRPSFTALVASVDTTVSKYVAMSRVQTGRQEMIDDLEDMCKEGLTKWQAYRAAVEKNTQKPARLFFYRDGVSEGQFQQVLDLELPRIKGACAAFKIAPKITLVVVGKRHHIRMCPVNPGDADRSGNCPAGTTIDAGLGHPTEFDYYQQSHGGLLGTSRPAHYSVIYDENNLSADAMQAMSFALTHVYARATRSVSIPAPVYYADIVCSRAKNHYNPAGNLHLSDSATHTEATSDLQAFKQAFVPLNPKQSGLMYFM